MSKKEEAKKKEDEVKKEADGEGAEQTPKHDDEQQDIELIKKMIKKHLGDEVEPTEEECEVTKEMYQAHKEMGAKEDEAEMHAVKGMQAAKHIAAKKEAAEKKEAEEKHESEKCESEKCEDEAKKESEKKEDEAKKEAGLPVIQTKEAFAKLQGENAALKERLEKLELTQYIDKKLSETGVARKETRAFIEKAQPKNKQEFDKLLEAFSAGLKSVNGGEAANDFAGLMISAAKQTNETKAKISFAECIK